MHYINNNTMINFHKLLNLSPKSKKINTNKNSLIKANINFRIIASDVSFNQINKILVIYTDQENNIQRIYNIPSLIFINFDYIDLNKQTVFFIFCNKPEDTSLRMFVNDNEVNIDNYNTIVKTIPYSLLNDQFDNNLNSAV